MAWTYGLVSFYLFYITGNKMDATDEEIEDMKSGIYKWQGLKRNFIYSVYVTSSFVLAWLLNLWTVSPLDIPTTFFVLGIVLGIADVYAGLRRLDILAHEDEIIQIPCFKIAFVGLGVFTIIFVIIGYIIETN